MTLPWHSGDATPRPPLGMGKLIRQTCRVFKDRFTVYFPLVLLSVLTVNLLSYAIGNLAPTRIGLDGSTEPVFSPLLLACDIALTLAGLVFGGVIALGALDAVMYRSQSFASYLRQTLRHFFPIIILYFLLVVLTMLASLLVIVPGLYMAARYLPLFQVVFFENAGWSGLNRSAQLTNGYRWPLVGALLVTGLAIFLPFFLIAFVTAFVAGISAVDFASNSDALSFGFTILQGIVISSFYAVGYIFTAAIYFRLREIKEGVTIEQISATIG